MMMTRFCTILASSSLVVVSASAQSDGLFQFRHPALYQLQLLDDSSLEQQQNRRLNNDATSQKSDFGCRRDGNSIECKMSFGGGTYDVDEKCTTIDADTLVCDVCTTDTHITLEEDGSYIQFCYEFVCSAEKAKKFEHHDFSKACTCAGAHVNGQAWCVRRVGVLLFFLDC